MRRGTLFDDQSRHQCTATAAHRQEGLVTISFASCSFQGGSHPVKISLASCSSRGESLFFTISPAIGDAARFNSSITVWYIVVDSRGAIGEEACRRGARSESQDVDSSYNQDGLNAQEPGLRSSCSHRRKIWNPLIDAMGNRMEG